MWLHPLSENIWLVSVEVSAGAMVRLGTTLGSHFTLSAWLLLKMRMVGLAFAFTISSSTEKVIVFCGL